jgi:hypothetical protein
MTHDAVKRLNTMQRSKLLDEYIDKLEQEWKKHRDGDNVASSKAQKALHNAVRTTLDSLNTATLDIVQSDGAKSLNTTSKTTMTGATLDRFAEASAAVVFGATLTETIAYFVGQNLNKMLECETEAVASSASKLSNVDNEHSEFIAYTLVMLGIRGTFVEEVGGPTEKMLMQAVHQGCRSGFNEANKTLLDQIKLKAEAIKNGKEH